MSKQTGTKPSNVSTLAIPSCELSLIAPKVLEIIPFFDIITDTALTSQLINGVVIMDHSSSIYATEYKTGSEYTVQKQFTKNIKDSLGFSVVIPSVSFDFDGFSINRFPRIKFGCNDKIDSDWPLICGAPSLRRVSHCRRFFGRRFCVSSYVPDFDKRLNEIYMGSLQIPPLKLFTMEETILRFKYKLIPTLATSTKVSATKSYEITFGLGSASSTSAKILSFRLSKLVAGLTINIESLQFMYGGQGLNLENITIPLLVDQDLLFGGSITATADDKGNIKAYYFIKQIKVSLLQLMVAPFTTAIGMANDPTFQYTSSSTSSSDANNSGAVDDLAAKLPNVENAWGKHCAPVYESLKKTTGPERAKMIFNKIINFLRETSVDIAIGLLLCPQMLPFQPNILSCVFTSEINLLPFTGANKLRALTVPDDYIPNIPSLDANFFGDDFINGIINEVNSVVSAAERDLSVVSNAAKNFISSRLEGLSVKLVSHVPVPIIPNPNFV